MEPSHVALAPQSATLLKFYVLLWVSPAYQELPNPFSMVSLKHDLTVLRRSAARAEAFQLLRNLRQVVVLLVYAVNYRRWFPELARFEAYANSQLFLLDFTTST
jgi:hypothetical protein